MIPTYIDFPLHLDARGSLVAIEGGRDVPFDIRRVYYLFGTDVQSRRGFHAHKELQQVAVALAGSCIFLLDDGNEKHEVTLDSPSRGLLIDRMIWREMFRFSEDCILILLASDHYDESDYIRSYESFLKLVKQRV